MASAFASPVFSRIADRAEAVLTPVLWEAIDVAGISPERLERARQAWAQRIEGERRARELNQRFRGVCAAAGMPGDVLRAIERIERDETRHVELCTRISDAIGRPAEIHELPGQRMPDPDAAVTDAELARLTVTVFCLGEVCASSQVQALIAGQTDRGTREALMFILRDEVHHEKFGWALASELVPALDSDDREWLGAALAHSLAFYEDIHAGGGAPLEGDPAPLTGHGGGVIDDATFARAFYTTVETEILPKLNALGIPATEAWALRDEARAHWPR
jgi:hypothetical protein